MAANLVKCEPCSGKGEDDIIQLLLVPAAEVQRGDYVKTEYGWEQVLKIGEEKLGLDFIYLYFGRERVLYEYWDCSKYFLHSFLTIGRIKKRKEI